VRRAGEIASRSGSAYVAVLAVTSLLVITGIAGIAVQRARLGTVMTQGDSARARALAEGAVGLALREMAENDGWRSDMGGLWLDGARWDGSSTVSAAVEDPADGSLTDDASEAVRIVGTGHVNGARQTVAAMADGTARGYRVLGSAAHAGEVVRISKDTISSDRPVTSNKGWDQNGGSVGSGGSDTLTMDSGDDLEVGVVGWAIPSVMHLAELLILSGTAIDYADLDGGKIDGVVLSADHNPYGDENPAGIYFIDAGGDNVEVRASVVVATLIVLNGGPGSKIKDDVSWASPSDRLPSLVIDGRLEIDLEDGGRLDMDDLSGGSTWKLSGEAEVKVEGGGFIRVTTGPGDATVERGLSGIFLAGDDTVVKEHLELEGVLISGGTLRFDADSVTLSEGADYVEAPPIGMTGWYEMVLRAGSWERVVQE